MMQVTRCLHAALLVADTAAADDFYSGILGLSRVDRSLKYAGIWYQVGEVQLHLIEHPGYRPARPNPEKWGRNPHVAFAVADLDAVKARLSDRSVPFQASASGRAALFCCDPDGNIIELSQMETRS